MNHRLMLGFLLRAEYGGAIEETGRLRKEACAVVPKMCSLRSRAWICPPLLVPTRPPGGCRIRGERVGKRDVALVKRRALRAHGIERVG